MTTVYAKQYGRLGNNLFQKAAAIGYGVKHGIRYQLCNYVANVAAELHIKTRQLIKERGHHYQELSMPTKNRIILDGYWQSEKYFAHCRQVILKAFGYSWAENDESWCSVHVRRGDYLNYPDKHPVVTEEYLIKAINYMIDQKGHWQFRFFSDDIAWCENFVSKSDFNGGFVAEFRRGFSEEADLIAMSCCEDHIISNSTFSWWGAWLNQNPDKVVISPSKDNWFGPGNAHLDTSDLIPDSWIQIKY